MRQEIPAVRIWPMSDQIEGFRGRSIEDVQQGLFLRALAAKGNRFRYPVAGLKAPAGTVVLFQYRARVIASGVFVRDEKFERRSSGGRRGGGTLQFEAGSFRTFEPVDVEGMRKVWPGFRAFGHVKQFLNPTLYPLFKRRLKRVRVGRGGKSE